MPDTHHLIVSYASTDEPGCQQALQHLQLPQLTALVKQLHIAHTVQGNDEDFAPPHERVLAQALQLPPRATPWAALHQLQQGYGPADKAYAFITPCHWQVAPDQVRMGDLTNLCLSEAQTRTLLAIVAPWFDEDGITLRYDQPGRWIAQGEVFRDLETASLERIALRDIRPWLPDKTQAAVLHRLQTEMQMLLYTHGFNDAREAAGQWPINSFWIHGAGALPNGYRLPHHMPTHNTQLRDAALAGDWSAWQQAWQMIDATQLAVLRSANAAPGSLRLSLCSEKNAITLENANHRWWQKITQSITPLRLSNLLKEL